MTLDPLFEMMVEVGAGCFLLGAIVGHAFLPPRAWRRRR